MINKQLPPETGTTLPADPIKPAPRVYEDADPYTADHRDLLLSQSRMNLMAISQLSDLKANLMLTLSAVMLQFALVKVSDHGSGAPMAHYWVIVIGALLTILFSAYSTLPKAPLIFRELPPDTPMSQGGLMFFTSFIRLPLDQYKKRMEHVLSTPPHAHEAILEELHAHGRYIARQKYLPLRMAYISFLLTWIAGATLYILA